jgi:hypothetical protein
MSLLLRTGLTILLTSGLASGPVSWQSSAKALFHAAPGSTGNPYGPVGICYWFASEAGARFVDARDAGAGARVTLHVQSNTAGFLTAWTIDNDGRGLQLTPMEGQYSGYLLAALQDYAVPNAITLPSKGASMHLLILFARSQTEQVGSAAGAREKIQQVSTWPARDGGSPIVSETDAASAQACTYVVHREGAQPGIEVEIGDIRR